MYATLLYYNQHGSLIRRDYEDDAALSNAIIRLREKKVSFRVEYGEYQ